jgi:hypothetical protein
MYGCCVKNRSLGGAQIFVGDPHTQERVEREKE